MATMTNEEKLDMFADILEPCSLILADDEMRTILEKGGTPIKAVSAAIKRHKKELLEVLARLDGVQPEDYTLNGFALIMRTLKLFNMPETKAILGELFTSQGQNDESAHSGSAMEIIEGGVK